MAIDKNRVASEQICRDRQKKTAEVFTPLEMVHQMNDTLPDEMWWDSTKTFCDPAMGDGNILVAIYEEKLYQGHDPMEALSTIFGIDIMDDNVKSCKRRLRELTTNAGMYVEKDKKRINRILNNNIVWANSLEYDFRFRYKDNRAETSRLMAEDLKEEEC